MALLGRFLHLRYFRFGGERTLVNRMPVGKPIIRGTSRYPARARSGAS
jgi:hypothetical protein